MKRSDFIKIITGGAVASAAGLLAYFEWTNNASGSSTAENKLPVQKNNSTPVEKLSRGKNNLSTHARVGNQTADTVNVKTFGAKGDGSGIDDQPAIQKAINYASDHEISQVIIPKGDYTVGLNLKEIRPTALILKDNIHLVMDPKAILRLKKGTPNVKYNMLSVTDRKNVTIEGGTIIGNKLTRKGKPKGETGLGISLIASENVMVKNFISKQQWGDGIYIGRYGGHDSKCRNITLKNCLFDDNRRQGMSVISVDGLQVEDCEFNNTKGTPPQAGIDFEPNRADEVLQNIVLKDIKSIGSAGAGILFVLSGLESTNKPKITIEIKNALIKNVGGIGICITKHFKVAGEGYINFNNITVKNNGSRAAYYVRNWSKDAPPITFKNITAINPNTSGQGGTTQGSAFIVWARSSKFEQGNVHVDGFRVKNDSTATGRAPKELFVSPNLWNCSFKNIKSSRNNLSKNIFRLKQTRGNTLGASLKKLGR